MRRSQPDNYKKLMPLKKIAEASSYSFGYVSILAQRKKLKVKKIGNKYYSTQEWFDKYLEAHAQDGKKLPPEAARELTQSGKVVSESMASAELKNRIDNLIELAIKQKFEARAEEKIEPALKVETKKNIASRAAAPRVREEKKQEKKLDEILNSEISSPEVKLIADYVEPEIKFQSEWQENLKREAEDFSKQKNAAEKKIKSEIRNQAKHKIFSKIKAAIFSSVSFFVIPAKACLSGRQACLSGRQAGIQFLKEFFGTMKNTAMAAIGKSANLISEKFLKIRGGANAIIKKFIKPLKIASAVLSVAAVVIIFSRFAPGATAGFERMAKNIFSGAVSQAKDLAERGLKSKYLSLALEQAGNIKKFSGSENIVIPGKDSAARIKASLDNLFLASAGKVNNLSLALTDGIKQRNKILVSRLGAVKNQALFILDFWQNEGAKKQTAMAEKFFNIKLALSVIPDNAARFGQNSIFILKSFLSYEKQSVSHIAMLASERVDAGSKSDIKGRVAGVSEAGRTKISPASKILALANTTSKRAGEVMIQAKYGAITALNGAADTQKEISLGFGNKLAKLVSASSDTVGLVSESGKNKLASLENSINKTNDSMREAGSAINEYNNNGKKYLASQAGISLRSLADMYSKIVDMIVPDSLKIKYAKLYNAGEEKETVIKEIVVVKEKIQIPPTLPTGQAGLPTGQAGPLAKGGQINPLYPPLKGGQINPLYPPLKGGQTDLSITGNADIGGALNVSGPAKFSGKLSVAGQSEFFGDMVVDAALTAKTLLVTDYAQFAGAINAKAITADSLTSRDSLTVVGGSFIGGNEIIKGNLAVSGTFSAGHTEFPSLGVTGQLGAESLSAGSGGLVVSGNSYFSGPIDANDILDIDVKSGSALTVGDGANDTFVVDTNSDIITIAAALNLNGNADINGSLDLDTASTSAFAVGDGTNDNFIIDTVNDAITIGYSSTTDRVTFNNSQLAINSASSTTALLFNYGGTGNIMQILDDGVDRFSLADNGNIIQTASTTGYAYVLNQTGTGGNLLDVQDSGTSRLTIDSSGKTSLTASSTTETALSVRQNGTGDILNLFGGANEIFTVLAGGNIGIGSTTPGYKLSVGGSGYFDGGIVTASGFIATSSISASYFTAMDALATSTFAGGFSAASSLYVLQNGNVGIGTTSPLAKLSIQGTAGQNIFDVASSTGQSLLTIDHTGQCVTGDTKLKVKSSKLKVQSGEEEFEDVQIKDIKGGEYVLSLNEKTGKLEPAKIKGLLDMGVKPIYEIETEDGKKIRTTGNHPYLSKKLVSDVFSGRDFNNAEQIFGFGNIKDNSNMETNAEPVLTEVSSEFFDAAMMKRMIEPSEIAKFIFNFGLDKNRQSQNLFLNFFVDDELEHNYIADSLRAFLRSLNIFSPLIQPSLESASAMIEAYRARAAGELNSLSHSSNSSLVNSNINFSNAAADALVFGSKTPITDLSLISSGCDNDKVCIVLNVNNLSNNYYNNGDSNLSNSKWTKVAELSVGDKIAVADESLAGIKFVRIAKIALLPPEQVYDIEVEGTHNFVANGIIAHNTYISGNTGIGTTTPVSALHALKTTEQLRLGYDSSNYISYTVGATGDVVIAATGGDISYSDENLTTTGNIAMATASSTSIVKFAQIYSDTGAISFDNENLTTTGNMAAGTFNGNTITTGTGVLTLGAGKTLTVSDTTTLNTNAITLAGGEVITFSPTNALSLLTTGSTSITFPTSGTLYGTATDSITSAQLLTSLSDETGTGSAVFSTSPTLVTPALGTPSALVLTNATGLLPAGMNLTKGNFLVGNDAGIAQATSTIFISSTGNVGIGTSSPLSKLSVQGTSGLSAFNVASSTGASMLYVSSTGNVGIGTTNPGAKLEVRGNIYSYDDGNSPLWRVGDDTSNYANMQWVSTNYLSFGTREEGTFYGNALVVRTGKVGLGVVNPQNPLDVEGGAVIGSTYSGTNTAPANGLLVEGNVGIGTTTPASLLNIASTLPRFYLSDTDFATNGHWFMENDAGVFSLGTTSSALAVSGTRALSITNAGNVGIGTTNPSGGKLVVKSAVAGVPELEILSSTADDTWGAGIRATGGSNTSTLRLMSSTGGVQLYDGATAYGLQIYNAATSAIYLNSNGNSYFNGGNVGIGTTTPGYILDVSPLSGVTSDLLRVASSTTGTGLIVKNNGNVGIGTTSPSALLTVGNNNQFTVDSSGSVVTSGSIQLPSNGKLWAVNANSYFVKPQNSGTNMAAISGLSGVQLMYNGTEGMRLNSTGNVGIGTTTPGYILDVSPLSGVTSDLLRVASSTTGTGLIVKNNGNVGIGTTTPGAKLDVNGNIQVSGGNSLIVAKGTGTNRDISFYNASQYDNIASLTLYPSTGTNVKSDMFISPRGTGYTTSNRAGIIVANTDYVADSTNYEWINIARARGTDFAIYSEKGGTGSLRPIILDAAGTSAGSTPQLYLSSAGNVGIGTTTPASLLNIASTLPRFYLSDTDFATNGHWFMENDAGVFSLGTTSSALAVSGTRALSITNAGNVGIGTTTPGYILDVSPLSGVTSDLLRVASSTTGTGLIVKNNGNVGIGTTAPGGLVHLKSTGDDDFIVEADSDNSGEEDNPRVILRQDGNLVNGLLGINGTAGARYTGALQNAVYLEAKDTSNNSMQFVTGGNVIDGVTGTARMTILHTGNVGIGTTTPGYILDVSPLSGVTSDLLRVASSTTGTGLIVKNNGNVGIGTTSPGAQLEIVKADSSALNDVLVNPTAKTSGNLIALQVGGVSKFSVNFSGHLSTAGTGDNTFSGSLKAAGQLKIDGTGNSYILGNVGIGTTTPGYILDVSPLSGVTSDLLRVASSTTGTGLIVKNNGNVGIGTTNPLRALYIESDNYPIFKSTSENSEVEFGRGSGSPYIVIDRQGTDRVKLSSYGSTYFNPGDTTAGFGIKDTTPDAFLEISADGGAGDLFMLSSDDANDGDRFVVKNSGNVGIGTSSPLSKLSVQGTSGLPSLIVASSTGASVLTVDGTGNTIINGNVGIGTTSPRTTLDVNGASSFNNRLDLYPGGSATRNGIIGSQGDIGSFGLTDSDLIIRATGRFAVGTNNANTARLVIATDGNVGIGTTNPGEKLHIYGSGTQRLLIQGVDQGVLKLTGTGNSYSFAAQSTGNFSFFDYQLSNERMSLLSNGNIYMSGNVGIGTTTPGYILDVSPLSGVTSDLLRVASSTTGTGLIVKNDGNVGIGTTSPNSLLHVYAASNPVASIDGGNGNAYLNFQNANVTRLQIADAGGVATFNNVFGNWSSFQLANVEQFRYDANGTYFTHGNVGIGTTTPGYILDVSPLSGVTSDLLRVASSTTGTGLIVKNDGNVGIGTTNPNSILHVNGTTNDGTSLVTLNQAGTGRGLYVIRNVASATRAQVNFAQISATGGALPVLHLQQADTGEVALAINTDGSETYNFYVKDTGQIYTAGNVGIGTTTPAYLLDVDGDFRVGVVGKANTFYVDSANERVGIGTGSFATDEKLNVNGAVVVNGRITSAVSTSLQLTGGLNSSEANSMYVTNSGSVGLGTTGSSGYGKLELKQTTDSNTGGLAIGNSGYTRTMRLWVDASNNSYVESGSGGAGNLILNSTSGNVGIGTTTPGYILDVSPLSGVTSDLLRVASSTTGTGLIVKNDGKVGIGTTNPGAILHVVGPSAGTGLAMKVQNDAMITGTLWFSPTYSYANQSWIGLIPAGGLGFNDAGGGGTNSAPQMILNDGNVGIGTTTPGYILDVSPLSGVTSDLLRVASSTTGTGLIVKNNGNVGIGTTNPGYRLELPNVADATGQGRANAWPTYSSGRWKENVSSVSGALDKINQLNPVYFNWKAENGGTRDLGFIAEEVGAVISELVTYEADGVYAKAMDYGKMSAMAIAGVKELNIKTDLFIASSTGEFDVLGSGLYITDSQGQAIFSRNRDIGVLPNRDMSLTATNLILDATNTTLTGTTTVANLCLGGICKNAWDNLSGFLTGFTETDPLFTASPSYGIGASSIAGWNSAAALTASSTALMENIKFDERGNIVISAGTLADATSTPEVQIVDITTITASSTGAAFVVNQVGIGVIADFQAQGVSVMSIAQTGEVKVVGSLLVDGRIMLCTGGQCSNALDSATDATMADLGVEGKVVAGAFEGYCDPGYVWVPGSAKNGTLPGFCVMADLMEVADGVARVNVSQGEAQVACQTLGTGYHLLGENEWLTIAENILQVAENTPFNKGGVGGFKLTNDNIINNLTGTTTEWTSQNITSAGLPITPLADGWFEYGEVTDFKGMSIAPAYYLTDANNHIGKIKVGSGTGLRGFVRGEGGIYGLDLSHTPAEQSETIGFRCAK